jgi:hypothetical protein
MLYLQGGASDTPVDAHRMVKNPGPEPSKPDSLVHEPPQEVYAHPRDDKELLHPKEAEVSQARRQHEAKKQGNRSLVEERAHGRN